jgi:hypothetical protein
MTSATNPSTELSSDQKRRLAFTTAQTWGADLIWDELNEQTAPIS